MTSAQSRRTIEIQPAGYYQSWVIDTASLTPTTRAIRLSKPPGFDFRVSQAVLLTIPTPAGFDRRPMSIASAPTRPYLEFAARLSDSPFKRAFFALEPGDYVAVQGPRGHFFLDTDRPAILVAGGIGVTPLKSMAEYAADLQLETPITLVYGNHSPSEIAYRSELDELRNINPHFDVIHTISEPDRNWEGRTGRVDAPLLREAASRHDRPAFYLAGPPSMVADSHRSLVELRVSRDRIRYEMFRGYL